MTLQPSTIQEDRSGLIGLVPWCIRLRSALNPELPSRTLFIAVAGLVLLAGVVLASTLASAPPSRTEVRTDKNGLSFSPQIEGNVAALRRSRAWWEGYGQRYKPSRPGIGSTTP